MPSDRHFVRRLVCAISLACTLFLATEVNAEPDAVQIGPFRVGMTLEAVRAAAPSLKWTSDVSADGTALQADDALTIGGASFSISIRPASDGRYFILASHDERNETLDACRSHLAALVEEFEPAYGKFEFVARHWRWPRPGQSAKDVTSIKIGEHSKLGMRVRGVEEGAGISFATALASPPRDTLVEIEGLYVSDPISGCLAQVRIVKDSKHRYQ